MLESHVRHCGVKNWTFIELIAIVAIATILFTMMIPRINIPKDRLRLRYEAALLRSAIRYTQTLAMRDERQTQTSQLILTGSGYSVTSSGVPVRLVHTGELVREFDGISSNAVNMEFNSWGAPVDAAGNELTEDLTVTLQLGNDYSSVVTVLAKTGFVK